MPKEMEVISASMERAVFNIFPAYCKGCGLCTEKCPNNTLKWSDKLGAYGTPTVIPRDEDSCIACMICAMVCPDCAIVIERKKRTK
jgi:2-oxoglutarate ferredoxin oxidoreductase subunit delta